MSDAQKATEKRKTRKRRPSGKKVHPTIIVALIGGIVTILVTLISNIPGIQSVFATSTPYFVTVLPTTNPSFISSASPTFTIQPTETSIMILTSTATSIPILTAGKDWPEGCISTVWITFPTSFAGSSVDGCYAQPVAGALSTRAKRLKLFVDKSVSSAEVVGVFTEVPSDSVVNIFVHLETIETGELWLGVFSEPRIDSEGLLVIVPEGDMKNSAFAAYEMPEDVRFYLSSKFLKSSADYQITFDVSPSDVVAVFEKYSPTASVPVVSNKKYLFLGYQAVFGERNRITAEFFDLAVTPR